MTLLHFFFIYLFRLMFLPLYSTVDVWILPQKVKKNKRKCFYIISEVPEGEVEENPEVMDVCDEC